ncbi:MAG: nicotinamide-nucleotide amidohydrolase family protein [Thermoleophilia bacterium]|nr:nicotinamide-nucleotide amidohydrolase family protein [Thermoleophilia bacterium]
MVEGRVREQNAGVVARDLADRGVRVERVVWVGDGLADLSDALAALLGRGLDLVVVTGGLGPTHDDRTMEAVAGVLGRPLARSDEALALVQAQMRMIGVRRARAETLRAGMEKQATLPAGAVVLAPAGTAPGAVVGAGRQVVVVLPGPPWEARAMWAAARTTAPVAALLGRGDAGRRVLRLAGVVESQFVEALGAVPEAVRDAAEVGVCARGGELEVTVRPGPGPQGATAARAVEEALDAAFGAAVFSRDGREVDQVVADALLARGEVLAVAESCTGGGLGARITAWAGSSAWFAGGVIAYANGVKESVLGVPPGVLARDGAVSRACAEAMAEGARRVVGAAWALSVTGVAGPGGGTAEKPVGLVWIAAAGPDGVTARELRLGTGRERIRDRSATEALHLLRERLGA